MTVEEFIAVWIDLPDGWQGPDEALMLMKWALKTEGDIVEVGTHLGRSAHLLAATRRRVHCVDPWDDGAVYMEFMGRRPNNVTVHRCRIEDWKPIPAGLVYLDGDHSEEGTKAQIEKALACKPQALAMHDVGGHAEGVVVEAVAYKMLGRWSDKLSKLAVWRLR